MAHIKILDASEQEVFDSPPVLTGIDRKRFLDLSVGVKKIVDSLRTQGTVHIRVEMYAKEFSPCFC